jgi:hypothetical protein
MSLLKPLAIAAVLIATLAPAKAAPPTMPAEYRGDWCKTGGYYTQRKHVPPAECETDIMVTLTATELQFEDGACKLKKIKPFYLNKVNLPEGLFTCDGEEGEEIPFVFTTGSGSLGYNARRLYLKQQEQEESAVPAAPQHSPGEYECPATLPICTIGRGR